MGFVKALMEMMLDKIIFPTLFGDMQGPIWMMVLHMFFVAMTMVWLFRLHPRIAPGLGKTFGGLAVGLLTLTIMITLGVLLVNKLVGAGVAMMFSGVRNVPLFGDVIADLLEGAVLTIVGIVLPIMIGYHVLKNLGGFFGQAKGHLEGAVKGWQGDGPGGVKLSYSLAATFIVASLINRPEINTYYIPSGLSVALGVYSLFRGTQAAWNVKAKLTGKPRADGGWVCIYKHTEPLVVDGKPVLNADGTPKLVETTCKGPDAPYNGVNPKGLKCLKCGHSSHCWTTCSTCGNKGEDGKGIPHDEVCRKCNNLPSAKVSTPASAPNGAPTTSGKVCESCGTTNDADLLFCENCGGKLSQQTQPSVTPVASPAPVSASFGSRYQPTRSFPENWL